MPELKEIKIDAAGKPFGRLASEIAVLLQGKNEPTYNPRLLGQTRVVVVNLDKVKFTGKKLDKNIYYRHSGYLGGLKQEKMIDIFKKDPVKLLKMSVRKMLPKNKLRDKRLKRLIVQ